MTRRRAIGIATALAVACAAAARPATQPAFDRATTAAHGMDALDLIRTRMALPERGLYAQEVHPPDPALRPIAADCWSVGVALSALTAGARIAPEKYTADVRRFVDMLNSEYWSDHAGIGGYDAGPHPQEPDRYYDDNAWIALGLVEAYEVTHDRRDLDRAAATLRYVLSGEDAKLGGGLYWRELHRESKNTCSNGPAIAAAVRVYNYTRDPSQLAAAVRLYGWTVNHLRDQADGLYFDNLRLDGRRSDVKWTYNTALMIRGGCLLHDATGDAGYLGDAQRSATAALAKWVRPETGAIAEPSYFAHLLGESLLELSARDHDPTWADADHRLADDVWSTERDPAGFFPEKWGQPVGRPLPVARLINQASAARLLLRAAWPDAAPPVGR